MVFLENKNKEMLWSVLQDEESFKSVPNKYFVDIQDIFENTLNMYARNNTNINNSNILQHNKNVFPLIFQNIREFIQKKNSKPEVIYTSEDIQKKREEEFQFKMREQENNMKSILNPPKPKEVRFADDNEQDKPIGENMDALVSEMLAKREKQLEVISIDDSDKKEAEKWLSSTSTSTQETSIFSKLKKKDSNQELLLKILENQKLILEKLDNRTN
jgi:hypothetical protein